MGGGGGWVVVLIVILMLSVAPWVPPKEALEITSKHVAMEYTSDTKNKNLPHESKLAALQKY